jgi:hypothetical protein
MALASSNATKMIFMGVTFSLLSGSLSRVSQWRRSRAALIAMTRCIRMIWRLGSLFPGRISFLVEKNSLQRKSHVGAGPITPRSHDVDRRDAFELRALFGAI